MFPRQIGLTSAKVWEATKGAFGEHVCFLCLSCHCGSKLSFSTGNADKRLFGFISFIVPSGHIRVLGHIGSHRMGFDR
jgi:hypothetical protein